MKINQERTQIIFATSKGLGLTADGFQDQGLLQQLGIRPFLLNRTCLESNGFSGSEPLLDDKGNLVHFDYWSRFVIKRVYDRLRPHFSFAQSQESFGPPIPSSPSKTEYPRHGPRSIQYGWEWVEIGFFVRWTPPSGTVVLCLDVPNYLQSSIHSALEMELNRADPSDAHSIFATILAELVCIYDDSVWSIRDHTCQWEAKQRRDPDYPLLHEITRHAIHVSETLAVAVQSVQDIHEQEQRFLSIQNTATNPWTRTQSRVQFPLRLLQSLLARSESNKARLQNETTLAFHTSASRDTQIQLRLADEAKKETLAMKAIAVITMTFLPATFISSVFSMSFFYFQPGQDGHDEVFVISHKFWIFWVLIIPLSLATISLWVFWDGARKKILGHKT
ncbi:hypothetical protein AK830_g2809 [Neonectria ditissima]|uniref:Uncharacterized protein n=1 Tax=Neonectria ditissima TaxID=78410 RepID=A0A0N8H874_9HYPO|nr:hypothetical protein AK830_g2809 [Neonectria ditissima]